MPHEPHHEKPHHGEPHHEKPDHEEESHHGGESCNLHVMAASWCGYSQKQQRLFQDDLEHMRSETAKDHYKDPESGCIVTMHYCDKPGADEDHCAQAQGYPTFKTTEGILKPGYTRDYKTMLKN